MLRIGLTGNVASGKSEVARIWAMSGVPVVSADALAREVVIPGSSALEEIQAAFGSHLIRDTGELDRERTRELVFTDAEARRTLERILHPRIEARRQDWIAARRAEGAVLVVAEIPLLYETGLEDRFDKVVLVDAPEPERERRLIEDRQLKRDQARRIMASQLDTRAKRERADFVIDNDGDFAHLRTRALEVIEGLRGGGPMNDESAYGTRPTGSGGVET